jgi:hypothetical protein
MGSAPDSISRASNDRASSPSAAAAPGLSAAGAAAPASAAGLGLRRGRRGMAGAAAAAAPAPGAWGRPPDRMMGSMPCQVKAQQDRGMRPLSSRRLT